MGPKRRKGSGFRCPDCGIIFDRVRAFERHYRLRGKLKQRASKSLHICRANMNTTGIITDESFEAYQLRAQSTRRSQLFSAAAPRKASPSRSISSSRSKAGCDFSVEDSHSRLHQRMFNDEQHATAGDAAKQDSSTLSVSDKRFTAGYTFEPERPSYDVASSYPAERELQCPPLDGYESYESWASGAGELRTSHESSTFHAEAGGEDVRSRDNSISQLPTSDSGVEERNRFGRDDATEGGGSHRSADVDGGNKPQVDDGMIEDNPRYGHPSSLGDIHRMVGARLGGECMEGLGIKERFFGRAKSKEYTPFKTLTKMLLFVFAVKHQISRVGISDLFSILRYVDEVPGDTEGEGATFDVADVPQDGEHFVSRLREYLPLFQVWTRNVVAKQSAGVGASAKVYDIPITHILESLLKSPSAMDEMRKNPGGAVLSKDEGEGVGLGSEHLFSMATRPVDNARRNYMHGRLASSMPQYNTDGFISLSGRKVYISDTVMCDLRDADVTETRQVPCRVVKSHFDEETLRLVVVVRCFRNANEVLHIGYSHKLFRRNGFVRLWEENGMGSETNLRGVKQVLDLVEILTADEVSNDIHKRPWRQGERRSGWSFVAEGFTERKAGGRFARVGRITDGWRRHGATDENFPDMRAAGVYHNQDNRPFLNLTTCIYVDDFNVWGMTNPVSYIRFRLNLYNVTDIYAICIIFNGPCGQTTHTEGVFTLNIIFNI